MQYIRPRKPMDKIKSISDPKLWIFLGDSLTEGIGAQRVSWVSRLLPLLRGEVSVPIHALRLRMLNLSNWRDLGHFNLVGNLDFDKDKLGAPLWLVNLAAESTTIGNDVEKSALIAAMRPDHIFILRGPLETIVRPLEAITGRWPAWVPRSWRGLAAMDPRCYYSAAFWRRAKQLLINHVKQRVRFGLLHYGGRPLLSDEEFLSAYEALLESLVSSRASVTILAIPPVSVQNFPGTMERVASRNRALADLAKRRHVEYLSWPVGLDPSVDGQFCRDGFHPTEIGASEMAKGVHAFVAPTLKLAGDAAYA